MIHNSLNTFIKEIAEKRILALDISKKRIGIAVSDSRLKIALPLKVIIRTKFLLDIEKLKTIYNEYNCGGIVIGYPLMLDGSEGARCQSVKDFTNLMLNYFDIPVFFENEQYSTFAAKDYKKGLNLKIKKPIDDSAATYFLQSVLDKL